MDPNPEIKEPILVKNPLTGKHINIAPLFTAMNEADGPQTAASLKDAVGRVIRHLNLTPIVDGANGNPERLGVNYDLYRLEDMFQAMSEI